MNLKLCTRSGIYFDFEHPTEAMVELRDIAHALARINRYNGHIAHHYSVAEHSILTSLLVPPQYAREALMHDAHEFVVGDMTAPLKAHVPGYAAVEERVRTVVARKFGLPLDVSAPVKTADQMMVRLEQRMVMENTDAPWVDLPMPPLSILGLCPHAATAAFLERAHELGIR